MLDDARLEGAHVNSDFNLIFNLGLSWVDSPLTVKNSDDSAQIDSIVDEMYTGHFGVGWYLMPWLQLGVNMNYSQFQNNLGEEFRDLSDSEISAKFRLIERQDWALAVKPFVTVPFNGGETEIIDKSGYRWGRDAILSDEGVGLGAKLIYEQAWQYLQLVLNLGYVRNDEAKLVDNAGNTQIDMTQKAITSIGAYLPVFQNVGFNVEFQRNWSQPFGRGRVNPTEFYFGASAGLVPDLFGFFGVGFGNFFSQKDGNDTRIVAGIKYTPTAKEEKETVIIRKTLHIVEPRKKKPDCNKNTIFASSNSLTFRYMNDIDKLTDNQTDQLKLAVQAMKKRLEDIQSIRVEGFASNRGSIKYNKALSLRRAEGVRDALIGLGVEPSIIAPVASFGEEKPLMDSDEEVFAAMNRRVEVVIEHRCSSTCTLAPVFYDSDSFLVKFENTKKLSEPYKTILNRTLVKTLRANSDTITDVIIAGGLENDPILFNARVDEIKKLIEKAEIQKQLIRVSSDSKNLGDLNNNNGQFKVIAKSQCSE